MTTIAIIGAGSVGRALGSGLTAAGHDVSYGLRDPADSRYADLPSRATVVDAVGAAEVVILSVPATSVPDAVPSLGLRSGQVVVDATNAVRMPPPNGFDTMGALVASLVPDGVAVVKAFNTIGAEHLGDGRFGDERAFLPIAGDDAGAELVLHLAGQLGFDAVSLGGRDVFDLCEAHARLWIHLAFVNGWGRGFGFTVAGR
jgi:predicted dinucleotide-binding enzyme